ncbi:MAG: PQQ-binding-like beta-propeller repeat protein, partial [Fidelibacterota bacterium]
MAQTSHHHSTRVIVLVLLGLLAACSRGPRLLPDEVLTTTLHPGLIGVPEIAWQLKLPSPPTALLPLGQNALLVTSHRGEVYRIELGTGERITPIRQPLRKAITSQLLYPPGPYLYIASDRDEEIRAYHLARGRALWKRQMKGVRGNMTIAGNTLLTATVTGKVMGSDTARGHIVWHHKLPGRIYQGVWTCGDLAFILNDQGILYAFLAQPTAGENDRPRD